MAAAAGLPAQAVVVGAAGSEEPSVCGLLAEPNPLGDNYGTRLQLRFPTPEGWSVDSAAEELMTRLKPQPAWVGARTTATVLEFVAVWGRERQPQRSKLKVALASALGVGRDVAQAAFQASGVRAWRFDAVAALRRMRAGEAGNLSCAGLLTGDVMQKLEV